VAVVSAGHGDGVPAKNGDAPGLLEKSGTKGSKGKKMRSLWDVVLCLNDQVLTGRLNCK
jgi:hypothetical protein